MNIYQKEINLKYYIKICLFYCIKYDEKKIFFYFQCKLVINIGKTYYYYYEILLYLYSIFQHILPLCFLVD